MAQLGVWYKRCALSYKHLKLKIVTLFQKWKYLGV